MFLPQTILKIRSESSKSFAQFNISYVILKSFVCNLYVIRTSIVCTRMPLICHSHITCMCSYIIRMSLLCVRKLSVCTRIPIVCHSMYSYVIRMSLVCTRMSSVCHSSLVCAHMSSACHSYMVLP